jgi:group I intron endonuclease
MKSGIYKILCTGNDEFYIGSAKSINNRLRKHKSMLFKKSHPNKKLQNAYNKYGVDFFIYSVIEYVSDINNLINREQFYIDELSPSFNIRLIAQSNLGLKFTNETKENMSKSRLEYFKNNPEVILKLKERMILNPLKPWLGKKSPNSGKTYSDDRKNKMRYTKATKGIIEQYDMQGNFIKEWDSIIHIQDTLGYHTSNILRCLKGGRKSHKNTFGNLKINKIQNINI